MLFDSRNIGKSSSEEKVKPAVEVQSHYFVVILINRIKKGGCNITSGAKRTRSEATKACQKQWFFKEALKKSLQPAENINNKSGQTAYVEASSNQILYTIACLI